MMKTSRFLNYSVLLVLCIIGAYWIGIMQAGEVCKRDTLARQWVHDFEVLGYSNMLRAIGRDLDKKRNELIRGYDYDEEYEGQFRSAAVRD